MGISLATVPYGFRAPEETELRSSAEYSTKALLWAEDIAQYGR